MPLGDSRTFCVPPASLTWNLRAYGKALGYCHRGGIGWESLGEGCLSLETSLFTAPPSLAPKVSVASPLSPVPFLQGLHMHGTPPLSQGLRQSLCTHLPCR